MRVCAIDQACEYECDEGVEERESNLSSAKSVLYRVHSRDWVELGVAHCAKKRYASVVGSGETTGDGNVEGVYDRNPQQRVQRTHAFRS
jgi:hypothetical protein